jgi:adenosylcobinamide-GDP ribazoletransferase
VNRGTLADAVRLGVGTLTVVPVKPPRRVDREVGCRAMVLAPLVAVIPAAAASIVCWAAITAGLTPLVAAVLAVGAIALTTRGLHLDGLADTADGLAAGYDCERALAVMRRGDVGPAGVVTLVLVVLAQVAALDAALRAGPGGALVVALAVIAGRATLPLACARGVPAARPDGLGAAVAGTVPRPVVLLVLAVVALVAALGCAAAGLPAWRGAAAVVAAALVAGLLVRRTVHRLGGVTGDVLGACVETATAAALLVLAA